MEREGREGGWMERGSCGRAAAAFRGTPWRPSEAALKQWPYPEARRGRLAAEVARIEDLLSEETQKKLKKQKKAYNKKLTGYDANPKLAFSI